MTGDGFPALLDRLLDGGALSEDEARSTMGEALDGDLGPERLAALLTALRTRAPIADELVGFARAMRERAHCITSRHEVLLDTCGTGGSPHKAFNVSTASAFALAAAGIPVAKHGNRSVTRPSGSADILEAAGLDLALGPDDAARLLDNVGIAFLFAPAFHPAMKHAGPVRARLGVSTVFNLLGPLANPAGATHHVLGVADPRRVPVMAESLHRLGVQGVVVHGAPGFDEATPCGPLTIARTGGDVQTIDPVDLGVASCDVGAIAPVEAAHAPGLMRSILAGDGPRAARDTVALNVALGLHLTGRAGSLETAVADAQDLLTGGGGATTFDAYMEAARA